MARGTPIDPIPTLDPSMIQAESDTPSLEKLPTSTPKGHRVRGGAQASMQWAKDRAAQALAKRQSQNEALVLQHVLPLWNDEHRGVPNPMIRSGLFGTKTSSNRQFLKSEAIASLSNYDIVYKGEELLQDDLSVWMALLNMAARQPFGDAIFFSGYELVRDLGWRMHSDSYRRAKESISRLKANELKIQQKDGSSGYAGSLIREYAWAALSPDGNEKWMVRFEPTIAGMFREDSVTFLFWEQRCKIGQRSPLAMWLHSYYASHRDPFPHTVAKLHELCKSDEKELRFFKRRLAHALDKLVEVGFLISYNINTASKEVEGHMVSVRKTPGRLPGLKTALTERLN